MFLNFKIFSTKVKIKFFLTFKNSFIYSCVPDHTKYSHGVMTDRHLDLMDTYYGLADIGPGLKQIDGFFNSFLLTVSIVYIVSKL